MTQTPPRGLVESEPFTHLAIAYQEVLSGRGHSRTRLPAVGAPGHRLPVRGISSDRLRDTFAEEV
jgi:hypothetical protein